jgi:G:T/U-mismatch repair DNA glycosylase
MPTIRHQLFNQKFYIPDWEIKYLLLGTFNPEGGEIVNYYYGRPRNQTWILLSEIFGEELNPELPDFFSKLKKHKIACMDLIHEVIAPIDRINGINGEGYKDSKIINTSVYRIYNTASILNVIDSNPNLMVFSTWGKGAKLEEWKNEVSLLGPVISLVSPSLAARVPKGEIKFNFMLNDWSHKFNL